MIGEISIMAGYSAIELAWLLTLIIEPEKKNLNNYLSSCTDKLMKHLPDILESLGYSNAKSIIDNYFSEQRELLDIFDLKQIDIAKEIFEKEIRAELKNHLFDSGEVQEVIKIEWKKAILEKKQIVKGDELFMIRLVEAQSFLDMLVDYITPAKASNQKYNYTAGNEEPKSLIIFDDDMLRVRHSENRNSYIVGVLYDCREKGEEVLRWALKQDYLTDEFARKHYSNFLKEINKK
jgi:hypothetical protein